MKVGILGAGQLGRMLALAGYRLGWDFRVFDDHHNTAMQAIPESITADYTDHSVLSKFAEGLDIITYEFENVPADTVEFLEKKVPTFPGAKALRTAQDRLLEKQLFNSLEIPTTVFAKADNDEELASALEKIGFPCVVKARRLGYDGKGQQVLRSNTDSNGVWNTLGQVPLLVENLVPFEREVSQVIARSRSGEVVCYPLTENRHKDGILRCSVAPATASEAVAGKAADYAKRIVEHLNYVGVLAIEFFQTGESLVANEIAPRVHNSGHWTQDAPIVSQFENHLRAIAGHTLGTTKLPDHKIYAMWNWIGNMPSLDVLSKQEDLKLHLYGKEPRPGRKIGHVNFQASSYQDVEDKVKHLESLSAN